MGHNLYLHFGADEHPCTTYFVFTRGSIGFDHRHMFSLFIPPPKDFTQGNPRKVFPPLSVFLVFFWGGGSVFFLASTAGGGLRPSETHLAVGARPGAGGLAAAPEGGGAGEYVGAHLSRTRGARGQFSFCVVRECTGGKYLGRSPHFSQKSALLFFPFFLGGGGMLF